MKGYPWFLLQPRLKLEEAGKYARHAFGETSFAMLNHDREPRCVVGCFAAFRRPAVTGVGIDFRSALLDAVRRDALDSMAEPG